MLILRSPLNNLLQFHFSVYNYKTWSGDKSRDHAALKCIMFSKFITFKVLADTRGVV